MSASNAPPQALFPAALGPEAGAPGRRLVGEPLPTLTEEAYRRIEELIVTLELAPGSVVSEAILSERIGIGTTPVREALQRLSREYLVQILPRRGVIVTQIDVRQQLQVLETRRELDRLIARLAARRALPAEKQQFAELAARLTSAADEGDVRDFLRRDGEFNTLVARASRNEIATRTVATLHSVSRRFWYFHHATHRGALTTMRLHVDLAQALATGGEDSVVQACDRLIDDLITFARSTVAPD